MSRRTHGVSVKQDDRGIMLSLGHILASRWIDGSSRDFYERDKDDDPVRLPHLGIRQKHIMRRKIRRKNSLTDSLKKYRDVDRSPIFLSKWWSLVFIPYSKDMMKKTDDCPQCFLHKMTQQVTLLDENVSFNKLLINLYICHGICCFRATMIGSTNKWEVINE